MILIDDSMIRPGYSFILWQYTYHEIRVESGCPDYVAMIFNDCQFKLNHSDYVTSVHVLII